LSVPRPLPLSDAECAQPEANTRTLARMRTRPCFRDLGRPGKPGARRMLAPLPFLIERPPVAQHPLAEDRVVLAGSGIRRCRDRDILRHAGTVEQRSRGFRMIQENPFFRLEESATGPCVTLRPECQRRKKWRTAHRRPGAQRGTMAAREI